EKSFEPRPGINNVAAFAPSEIESLGRHQSERHAMVKLRVNGQERSFDGDPSMPLLWYLRDDLERRPAGLPDRPFSNRPRASRPSCFCRESTGIATLHPLTAPHLRHDFGREY